MELKTRYQYTYFIHTYVINKKRYKKYLNKLLKDESFTLRIFEKEKDLELYTYFLPKIRNFLFKTFDLNKNKLEKIEKLPNETKLAILSEYPSLTFEYNLKQDMQGKTIDENSIFFKIQKIGVVCFNTGICFLYIKTNIEGTNKFEDLLNFNYKFKDINQECYTLKNYENIKVQADCFDDIKELKEFISNITGPNFDALKINLDVDRFYTYSYECIDQSEWNNTKDFDNIKNEFLKFINIMPNDKGMNIDDNGSVKIIPKEKFSKFGISKAGVTLFNSDIDIANYTTLPYEFENSYFYTYILALYLKVYIKQIDYNFKKGKNLKKTRQDFIDFTKSLWIQEITTEDMGSLLYVTMKQVLEIEQLYIEVKNQYDLLYREAKIDKTEKTLTLILVILGITMIFNILNWIYMIFLTK